MKRNSREKGHMPQHVPFLSAVLFGSVTSLAGPGQIIVPARDGNLVAADAHCHPCWPPSRSTVASPVFAWQWTPQPLLEWRNVLVVHRLRAQSARGESGNGWPGAP